MRKTIALVAHDNRKRELMEWAYWNREALAELDIVCTGTTGKFIEETLIGGLKEEAAPGRDRDSVRRTDNSPVDDSNKGMSDWDRDSESDPGIQEGRRKPLSYNIRLLKSGPIGGDQQLGAMIVDGKIDLMVFFWDPMQPQAHDVDVKALLRITVLYNIPTACNRSTADFLISSSLFHQEYRPKQMDIEDYLRRHIDR